MINFETDENLGQVVVETDVFSLGNTPIESFQKLIFWAGGYNISTLCGFKFISKEPHEHREFHVAFSAKIRDSQYRQYRNPPQWFIYQKISNDTILILSRNSILSLYNFDMLKFLKSDYFLNTIPKFKEKINKGLNVYIPEFVKKHGNEVAKGNLTSIDRQAKDVLIKHAYKRYTVAIQDSLEYIDSTKFINKDYHPQTLRAVQTESKKEKTLDTKIEEALKEIYR